MMLELVGAFFQINPPYLLFLVEFYRDIDTAFADIRIKTGNFFSQFFFLIHGKPPVVCLDST
jgi:hypothetical protein